MNEINKPYDEKMQKVHIPSHPSLHFKEKRIYRGGNIHYVSHRLIYASFQ